MRLPRAGSPPARGPLPALRIASVSRATVRLGRGRLRRHLIIERCGPFDPPLTEDRASHCSANAFSRVDLAARAREGAVRSFSRCSALAPDSPPPRRRPFGSRTSHRAVLPRLGSVSRSHAILPALSFGRRHSFRRSRRARTPLFRVFLPSERPARWLGLPGRVGAARRRPRSIRPMSAAHGCCFQRRGPKSRQTPHRRFPRDAGALGFTPSPLTSVS